MVILSVRLTGLVSVSGPWARSSAGSRAWSRRVSGAWTRSRPRSLSGMGAWTRSRSSYIPARG